ncbi:MAG TPA: hypothetical protein VHX44_10850 [Planctomycetota bacterium]|nr:hypothetical protein [Planctomycetota bacterium]
MNEPAAFATWAVELADRDLSVAASLRTRTEVRAAVLTTKAWLCGTDRSTETVVLLRRIPGAVYYRVDAEARLRRDGRQLPEGTLPHAPWLPLPELLPVQVPIAVATAGVDALRLELSVSDAERPVAGLLLTWRDLCAWVEHAPAHRCAPLRIARRADGQVLVLGAPLPPLRGTPLWACGPALMPCGLALSPTVPLSWLERALALPPGDLVLIGQREWQRIAASDLIPLSRAVARSDAW